jgi:hypothetical protein
MAAQEEKKVGFSAQDNGVSSFIKRLQTDTKQLFKEMSMESQAQAKNQKESLKLIEQQIAALERQNKLEREQNRLIAERKRAAGQLSDKAYGRTMNDLRDDAASSRLQMNMLKDMFQNMRDRSGGGGGDPKQAGSGEKEKKESVFGGVLAAQLFRDLAGLIRQVPNAQTDVDLISPFSSMVGAGAGGIAGSAIDAANVKILGTGLGNTSLGPMLAVLGKEIGGFVGDSITRSLNEQMKYETAEKRARGRTGRGTSGLNLAVGF